MTRTETLRMVFLAAVDAGQEKGLAIPMGYPLDPETQTELTYLSVRGYVTLADIIQLPAEFQMVENLQNRLLASQPQYLPWMRVFALTPMGRAYLAKLQHNSNEDNPDG